MTAFRAVQQSPLKNSSDGRSPAAAPPISNWGVSNKLSRNRLLICPQSEAETQRPRNTVYYNLSMGEGPGVDLSMSRRVDSRTCFPQHKNICAWTNEISLSRCWDCHGGQGTCVSDEWESKHSVKALWLILNKCRDLVAHSSVVVLF